MSLTISIKKGDDIQKFEYIKTHHLWICHYDELTSIEMQPDVLLKYIKFLTIKYKENIIEICIEKKELLIDEHIIPNENTNYNDMIRFLEDIFEIISGTIITKYVRHEPDIDINRNSLRNISVDEYMNNINNIARIRLQENQENNVSEHSDENNTDSDEESNQNSDDEKKCDILSLDEMKLN